MVELYIIRHGLATKKGETDDEIRPLTKKGKEQVKRVAKGLSKQEVVFNAILTSPLLRAMQTAEVVHAYCGIKKKVLVTDLLKPGASYETLIKLLKGLTGPDKVAIVGHEPFLSGFASYCLTASKSSFIHLKKGGVIVLQMTNDLKPGCCSLLSLTEPDLY